MQPIYFPHTYITDETVQTLSAYFQKITVYQPTRRHIPESITQWRDTDQLEIRCPFREFETEIEASLKSYQSLGRTHQGRRGEVKHLQPSGIPFFDNTSARQILAELTRKVQGDEPRNTPFTESIAQLVHAGLFLQMAQDFDVYQDGISRDMAACAGMEKNLFKNLREDDDSLFEELAILPLPSADRPGDHMLAERLRAWTRLFFHDIAINAEGEPFPSLPLLLITASRLLFDEMVAEGTDNTVIIPFNSNPLERTSFSAALTGMARATDPSSVREAQGPAANNLPISITVAVVFNEPPLAFLAKHAGISPGDIPGLTGREPQPNTLIALSSLPPNDP